MKFKRKHSSFPRAANEPKRRLFISKTQRRKAIRYPVTHMEAKSSHIKQGRRRRRRGTTRKQDASMASAGVSPAVMKVSSRRQSALKQEMWSCNAHFVRRICQQSRSQFGRGKLTWRDGEALVVLLPPFSWMGWLFVSASRFVSTTNRKRAELPSNTQAAATVVFQKRNRITLWSGRPEQTA